MNTIVNLIPAVDASRLAFALTFLFVALAGLLIYDSQTIKRDSAKAASLLRTHIVLLVFGAACATGLTYKLSLSTCQPTPAATVERLIERLDAAVPAEVVK